MKSLSKTSKTWVFIMSIFILNACSSAEKTAQSKLAEEFASQPLQPETILTLEDIAHLPKPVQAYLTYTGAIGKAIPQNVRIEFEADMFNKPGDSPMKATSTQTNFFGSFSRIFLMKASKMGLPFQARHIYSNQQATFIVRVASLFNVVDISGEELTRAETVTVLNDLCLFVPGILVDKRFTWREIDSLTTEISLTNGAYSVSALLFFNTKGELISFVSDDRSALQDDGSLKKARWTTPVGNYKDIDGRKIPTYGEAIWNYPEGDFTYGKFKLKSIVYNISK
ncbi:MAG: hypothetical protein J0L62_11115 [Bacteroidetes bacterium]|nr:hypothetical protein [Bacteroidota bacterium]